MDFEYPAYIYDQADRPRKWVPDFYLPIQGVYIEVYAENSQDNLRRRKIYFKNNTQVIFIHQYKPPEEWLSQLIRRLNELHQERLGELQTANMLATSLGYELEYFHS